MPTLAPGPSLDHRRECSICGGRFAEEIVAVETMFGMPGRFSYGRCGACGCLQCLDPPADLGAYYPPDYYSFSKKKASPVQSRLRGLKRRIVLGHPTVLTPLVRPWLRKYGLFWQYRAAGLQSSHRLLDVGAGAGRHVLDVRSAGVTRAVGIDPFVAEEVRDAHGVIVHKASLDQLRETFDFITFHHSLEHIADQRGTIATAAALLAPAGRIVIRIPTVSSIAFETYRENWYQLDAPRHLYLHSHDSLGRLAEHAGLRVASLSCDSTPAQFAMSEQIARGIRQRAPDSYTVNRERSIFSKSDTRRFAAMTRAANADLRGDQICAVLVRR